MRLFKNQKNIFSNNEYSLNELFMFQNEIKYILNKEDNKLYNIQDYKSNTCDWFATTELNKLNPITLKSEIKDNNITINMYTTKISSV